MRSSFAESGGLPSRWHLLLSRLATVIAVATVAGELSGYFHFLRDALDVLYAVVNGGARLIVGYEFSQPTLTAGAVIFALAVSWALFFLALWNYSSRFQALDLSEWLFEINHFLRKARNEADFDVAVSLLILFAILPLYALWNTLPALLRERHIFRLQGLEINSWHYTIEAAYLHTTAFAALMAVAQLFKVFKNLF
jgi:hypothetical protein